MCHGVDSSQKVGGGMTLSVMLFLAATHYITVAGLGGEDDYELRFKNQAGEINQLIHTSDAEAKVTTLSGSIATKAEISKVLSQLEKTTTPDDSIILMLIGHGTFDGADYKLNLPGPDLTAAELADQLARIPAKRQLIVNMTSASGASIAQLQKADRVVITATRSGMEKNAPVFARYWVEALRDPAADADKNGAVSALEAFRYADQKTATYYETQKRLATEHALLEDTGEGEGVRAPSPENGKGQLAARFNLVQFGDSQKVAQTPEKLALLKKKEELEIAIDQLKYRKAAVPAAEYRKSMQALLLQLARLQEEIDR